MKTLRMEMMCLIWLTAATPAMVQSPSPNRVTPVVTHRHPSDLANPDSSATHALAGSFTFSLLAGPAGAAMDPVTGVFTRTPASSQSPSTNAFVLGATLAGVAAPRITNIFTVVAASDHSWLLDPIPDQTVVYGTALLLQVRARGGASNDPPVYSLLAGPAEMSLSRTTGLLVWMPLPPFFRTGMPPFDFVGTTHTVIIRVTGQDPGGAGDTQSFQVSMVPAPLIVTANDAVKHLNGPFPALTTKSITGFVYGESTYVLTQWPQWAAAADANSPIGTYPITNSVPALASNYVISYVPGVLAITPNPPPIARDDAITAIADGMTRIFINKLLANDSDPDGHPLHFVLRDYPLKSAKGATIGYDSTALFLYYNTEAKTLDTNGYDTFSYRVQNGYGGTNQATVYVKYISSDTKAIPPNLISAVHHPDDGSLTLTFAGIAGRFYTVQGTSELKTNWTTLTLIDHHALGVLTNRFRCVNGAIFVTDPAPANHPSAFYRALCVP